MPQQQQQSPKKYEPVDRPDPRHRDIFWEVAIKIYDEVFPIEDGGQTLRPGKDYFFNREDRIIQLIVERLKNCALDEAFRNTWVTDEYLINGISGFLDGTPFEIKRFFPNEGPEKGAEAERLVQEIAPQILAMDNPDKDAIRHVTDSTIQAHHAAKAASNQRQHG